jgi:hypothetical protein
MACPAYRLGRKRRRVRRKRTSGGRREPFRIEPCLASYRRRLIARAALRGLARGLPWVLLGCAPLVLASSLAGVPGGAWVDAAPPALVVLIAAAAWLLAFRRALRPAEVALVLDRRLGTGELLIAAYEAGPDTPRPLEREARSRAEAVLAATRPRDVVAVTRPAAWRPALLGGLLVTLASVLPPAAEVARPIDARERKQLAAIGETLSPKAEEISQRLADFDAAELSESMERFESLVSELRMGRMETAEEALFDLAEIDRMLATRRVSPTEPSLGSSEVDEALGELVGDPFTNELGMAMQSGDATRLREAVRATAAALAGADLRREDHAERIDRLARTFEALAAALAEAGLADESEVLRDLAEALRTGDLDRARALLESSIAYGACSAFGERRELERELVDAISLARYLLGGAPLPLGSSPGGSGDGRGGPGPGSSSTNEAAMPYDTGDPLLRDRQSAQASSRRGTYEALYESHIVEAESWVDVQARGGPGSGGPFLSETGRSAGVVTDVRQPLWVFAAAARGAPERAAELERVPLGYRDVVRRYFTRDAPPEDGGRQDHE